MGGKGGERGGRGRKREGERDEVGVRPIKRRLGTSPMFGNPVLTSWSFACNSLSLALCFAYFSFMAPSCGESIEGVLFGG